MRLIIDNREHDLIPICQNMIAADTNYTTVEVDNLPIGDILVKTDEGKDVMIVGKIVTGSFGEYKRWKI